MKFNRETIGEIVKSGGNGMTKLASGAISSPVAFLDLTLSTGYSSFALSLDGFDFSADDFLAFALSFDAGTTFLNNSDSYDYATDSFSGTAQGTDSLLAIPAFTLTHGTGVPICVSANVFPGNTDVLATVAISGVGNTNPAGPGSRHHDAIRLYGGINPTAALTPTPQTATAIRILPYGNGNCDPPTSGHTITTGSYVLWGISV